MSNPGHEGPFNKTAEEADRRDHPLQGIMNVSTEWIEAEEQARRLDERDPDAPVELVVAGGVSATKKDIQKLLPTHAPTPVDGPTYREETEYNDDGSPNANWPKE